MSRIRQIDYMTPRTLVSLNGRRVVRMTGVDSRYHFEGELVGGEEDAVARIGEVRSDWQKNAFPLPWNDSPDVVRAVETVPILIFGEVLYDCFPDGRRVLGGAPFNVAWHLKGLGADPVFVSAVGDDPDGRAIRSAIKDWRMEEQGLQTLTDLETGSVDVRFEDGEPSYRICAPRAWDRIPDAGFRTAKVFYHGSLALRDEASRKTFESIRERSDGLRFVDLNLRPPHYDIEAIRELVCGADWLKLNLAELGELTGTGRLSFAAVDDLLESVRGDYGVRNVLLTAGPEGARMRGPAGAAKISPAPAPAVFADPVGAGDAFSAVAILGILQGWDVQRLLESACSFASRVCGLQGATTVEHAFYRSALRED